MTVADRNDSAGDKFYATNLDLGAITSGVFLDTAGKTLALVTQTSGKGRGKSAPSTD